jgi:hypothetical protein
MAEMKFLDLFSRFPRHQPFLTFEKLHLTMHSAATFTFSNDLMINAALRESYCSQRLEASGGL